MCEGPTWGDWNRPGNKDRVDAMWLKMVAVAQEERDKRDRLAGAQTLGERFLIEWDRERLIDEARD